LWAALYIRERIELYILWGVGRLLLAAMMVI
jgi:hypothetical protein